MTAHLAPEISPCGGFCDEDVQGQTDEELGILVVGLKALQSCRRSFSLVVFASFHDPYHSEKQGEIDFILCKCNYPCLESTSGQEIFCSQGCKNQNIPPLGGVHIQYLPGIQYSVPFNFVWLYCLILFGSWCFFCPSFVLKEHYYIIRGLCPTVTHGGWSH